MPSPVHPYSEYGVALRTLRSARSWLGLLLFLCVVSQILGFALMWYTQQPYGSMKPTYQEPAKTRMDALMDEISRWVGAQGGVKSATAPAPKPEPFYPGSEQGRKLNVRRQWENTYTMCVPFTQMLGLVAVCSQALLIFLTLLLVLVAQAPGVAQVTRSLIWSVVLLFVVLPWQYFARDFPFPGVLYGYQELLGRIGPHVVLNPKNPVYPFDKLVIYARFIIWPLASMVLLLMVSERFRSGITLAIGHPLQSIMQQRTPAKPVAGAAKI